MSGNKTKWSTERPWNILLSFILVSEYEHWPSLSYREKRHIHASNNLVCIVFMDLTSSNWLENVCVCVCVCVIHMGAVINTFDGTEVSVAAGIFKWVTMVTLYMSECAHTYAHKHSKKKGNICSVSEHRQNIYFHMHTDTYMHAVPLHKITQITFQLVHGTSFSDTEITLCTKTHRHCCDPREQASCVCAGAVTPALIINQWANCKRTQSASPAHMTSPMHVNIHRVYKPLKVSGSLQYSWLIITDGWHTRHWYRTMTQKQTERSGGVVLGIINWYPVLPDCLMDWFLLTVWSTAHLSSLICLLKKILHLRCYTAIVSKDIMKCWVLLFSLIYFRST